MLEEDIKCKYMYFIYFKPQSHLQQSPWTITDFKEMG